MTAVAAILVVVGLLAFTAAAADWDVFFSERRANPMLTTLGRTPTRILYGVLGAGMAAAGILALTGVIEFAS